ncbi:MULTISPECIES: protein YpfM [Enterobacteriaceae]|uniref:Protein YpfM n=3 Tax=Salmonella enterica TaxID=28901 RepID=A0A633XHQ4_SALTI|nr:protein YpfM [Salmonella enterica]EBH8703245.1 hypothetical protein [Salmonella enterica subsp. enterica serovar Liverpool]EBR9312457.1 hypothetical protein [Salmonella enterica subsp. enterica serovar Muenchen]EBX7365118.1 hypothetical protein [Salmonella enterica subsp. enterica serovar Heidelberg]ECD2235964.1 hypothetical protein [Salmonella enterica subsp. enterica serovar Offa]EDM3393429.1 hypothetical protein [Salmonella enterica subsp. enterica serovar Newport]EDR4948231.1 protein Y
MGNWKDFIEVMLRK